jgi:hypothetical protein
MSRIASDIDLFLNQFGSYTTVLGRVRRSVYLDLDPGYTQIWQEHVRRRHELAWTRSLSDDRLEPGRT